MWSITRLRPSRLNPISLPRLKTTTISIHSTQFTTTTTSTISPKTLKLLKSKSFNSIIPTTRTNSIRFQQQIKHFHSTPPRSDILFVTVPAIKGALLQLVRVTLILLPFVSYLYPLSLGLCPGVKTADCFVILIDFRHGDGSYLNDSRKLPEVYGKYLYLPSLPFWRWG